ncbi:MAG: AMP-binding protein, partial [Clostridia bacterium]|nr:AMP-binding protein [Clostridia bacterium]
MKGIEIHMTDYYDEYIPGNYSVYEYLQKETKNCLSSTAISFYGKNFSYETMFQKIDEVARALKAYGVKKDDVVASSLPGTPEGIYIIYAINKIGAVY